ncbi:MAG: DUF6036 family nucleotidyltransferase [Coriobacteriales bacterium]
MQRGTLIKTLLDIDEEAGLELGLLPCRPSVLIVGGAAFMLRELTPRKVTHDIDVYHADKAVAEILCRYPQVNGGVAAHYDEIPYNFEDRLVRLEIGAKAIDFFTPSIEDLVVMKLYACRPNDLQDVDGAAQCGLLDWGLLDRLVYNDDEAKASCLSERRYEEMIEAYEHFKRRWLG